MCLDQAVDVQERMALPDGYRAPFSLLFRPVEPLDWPQGTFEFTHEAVGTLALFTAAIIDPQGHGRHAYEVIVA